MSCTLETCTKPLIIVKCGGPGISTKLPLGLGAANITLDVLTDMMRELHATCAYQLNLLIRLTF